MIVKLMQIFHFMITTIPIIIHIFLALDNKTIHADIIRILNTRSNHTVILNNNIRWWGEVESFRV